MDELFDAVKLALRIVSVDFDAEIMDIIAAAKADLTSAGVIYNPLAPLIRRAVVIYAKAHFGFSEDSEKYGESYAAIKSQLALIEAGVDI